MQSSDVYAKQGFGASSGFGAAPALLIVDFVNGFNDPDLFGGGNISEAISNTKRLLACARENVERDHIVKALDGAAWNVTQAARALGMERTNLHKRMRALGIDRRH